MKKRIKMKTSIFVWLLFFFLVTLLAACGQKESEETEERAFGIDYSEELSIPLVEQVICGQEPESLLYYILYGRQEEFVDWRQKTASFEGPEFMDVLALCKEYGEADWSDASEWTYEEHRWNTLCNRTTVAIDFATYLFNIDMYGREYSIYGYPTSYGQVYRIAACADSCAIYAGSQNKEGAWEFIESLLWDSNQKCLGIVNPGLPIRSSILQEVEDESKDQGVKINGEVTKITDGEIAIQEDIIYNGELVGTLINPDIWAVVQEEAASYFAGDKTAAEVAHIIQSRVGIILGE